MGARCVHGGVESSKLGKEGRGLLTIFAIIGNLTEVPSPVLDK